MSADAPGAHLRNVTDKNMLAKLEDRGRRIEALTLERDKLKKELDLAQRVCEERGARAEALHAERNELSAELEETRAEARQLTGLVTRLAAQHTAFRKLPPEELRLHVGTRTTKANYLSQGWDSDERVIEVFGKKPPGPMLDWGCGCGRTANWLLKRPGWAEAYHGCDVDRAAIRWLRKQELTQVEDCKDNPPLPYSEASFAGLFAFSVLTHIRPERHAAWYKELRRVLRPGGRAFLTVHGPGLIASGKAIAPESLAQFERDGHVIEAHEGHYKNAAIVSPDFTRKAFAPYFAEESYVIGGYHAMDAFVLVRKG